jgi:hypothetical protein
VELIDPLLYGGTIAAVLFAAILACHALGRWIGKHSLARNGAPVAATVGSLESAVFALLGLMIAFTFSGALNRFDVRRAQVVDEANAMGTAYLRIDLVPASAQASLRDNLRRYADARIATYRALPDVAAAGKELERSQALQADLWRDALAAVRMKGASPNAELLVVPALNAMFDIMTVRMVATRMHPPTVIYAMLIALALGAALLAGYQSAADKDEDWIHRLGFALIISLTLYVILDLEHPRLGLIRIDGIDQVLVDARAGMK